MAFALVSPGEAVTPKVAILDEQNRIVSLK